MPLFFGLWTRLIMPFNASRVTISKSLSRFDARINDLFKKGLGIGLLRDRTRILSVVKDNLLFAS